MFQSWEHGQLVLSPWEGGAPLATWVLLNDSKPACISADTHHSHPFPGSLCLTSLFPSRPASQESSVLHLALFFKAILSPSWPWEKPVCHDPEPWVLLHYFSQGLPGLELHYPPQGSSWACMHATHPSETLRPVS